MRSRRERSKVENDLKNLDTLNKIFKEKTEAQFLVLTNSVLTKRQKYHSNMVKSAKHFLHAIINVLSIKFLILKEKN